MDHRIALSVLGVTQSCTPRELREAYLDLVKVWHPDRFPPNSRLREKAEARLKDINAAYALLATSGAMRGGQQAPASGRHEPTVPPKSATAPPPAPRRTEGIPSELFSKKRSLWATMPMQWRVVVTCTALYFGAGLLNELLSPDFRGATVSSTAPATATNPQADASPVTIVSRRPLPYTPACDPASEAPPPRSGTELGQRRRGGRGTLTVKNGGADAIAVLLEANSLNPVRAIYVRRGESGIVSSIPQGSYRVRFQLGQAWLTSRRFCKIIGTSEFEDALSFEEVDMGDRTEFNRFELTLYAVSDGNAETAALPDTPLLLPTP